MPPRKKARVGGFTKIGSGPWSKVPSFKGTRSGFRPAFKSKRKMSYKKKTSQKGLPKTRVRTEGSFAKGPLTAASAPRHLNIQLESKYNAPDTFTVAAGAATISNQFFCTNNIAGTAWSTGGGSGDGDNTHGLDTALNAASGANPPRGLTTQLWDLWRYALVQASELELNIEEDGSVASNTGGFCEFALTPVSYSEAASLFTGAHATLGFTTANPWIGANAAEQWTNCINSPGTVRGRIQNLQSNKTQVRLKLKHDQKYFNTEPLWQGYLAYQCTQIGTTNGTFPNFMPTTYQNYYVLTFYQAAGNTASAGTMYFNVNVKQKWFVKAWQPLAPSLITMREKRRAAALAILESEDSKEEKKFFDDHFEDVKSGGPSVDSSSRAAPGTPFTPASAAAAAVAGLRIDTRALPTLPPAPPVLRRQDAHTRLR